MIQIYAILVDSLRLLRARKLFWIVMIISMLVGALYASVGFHDSGVSVLFGLFKLNNRIIYEGSALSEMFYLLIFTSFLNDWWFGFVALVLALISSCSIFPELMKEGAIDVMVSKPLSRLKLFITKYVGALLFMAVPVLLLCVICFVSMGLRVDVWKPSVFLAVPLLMLVFSLIYCVAVFAGVLWRSTLFALLSAVSIWSVCFLLHLAETGSYVAAHAMPNAGLVVNPETGEPELVGEAVEGDDFWIGFHKATRIGMAPLPKTRQATLLLKRVVGFEDELGPMASVGLFPLITGQAPALEDANFSADVEGRMSVSYILWSSAAFELVILSLAAWVFCRRDF